MADTITQPISPTVTIQQPAQSSVPTWIEKSQDFSSMIERSQQHWRGKRWVPNPNGNPGSFVETSFGKPLMNEIGVAAMTGLLESFMNHATTYSNYGDEGINERLHVIADTLATEGRLKYKEWGMDLESWERVYWEVVLMINNVYRQAWDPKGTGLAPWQQVGMTVVNENVVRDYSRPVEQKPNFGLPSLPFLNNSRR